MANDLISSPFIPNKTSPLDARLDRIEAELNRHAGYLTILGQAVKAISHNMHALIDRAGRGKPGKGPKDATVLESVSVKQASNEALQDDAPPVASGEVRPPAQPA